MKHPYEALPPKAFWRTAVALKAWFEMEDIYRPKFDISPESKIATAGSCFAQHISRHLRMNGYDVLDCEPAPPGLGPARARDYGYGLYSARYGNIYVVRHLLQLLHEAWGEPTSGDLVWERDGRYFDAMRPNVEPEGLGSPEEVRLHRAQHLEKIRRLVLDMDTFIFTLGLTECWVHRTAGTVYPTCPGVIAGSFDSQTYAFKNFSHAELISDFIACRDFIGQRRVEADLGGRLNPRFILTVSPVPLVATASERHVLLATVYSKSVLRAVAGDLAQQYEDVAYFPSYEIVSAPWSGHMYFEANRRDVSQEGVDLVMDCFFAAHGRHAPVAPDTRLVVDEDASCDEIVLEALAR